MGIIELYNPPMARQKKGGDGIVKSIVMPDELWSKLRVQSIMEKRSASEIIRKLVSEYLKKAKKGGER